MLQTFFPKNSKKPTRKPAATVGKFTNDARTILKQVELILDDREEYRRLLTVQGSLAQALLDLLQALCDHPDVDQKLRSNISNAMIRLSKQSGFYPRCFVLNDIEKIGDHPIAAGGFGEIWKGLLGGRLTCLKVVKIYGDSEVDKLVKGFLKEAILWRQLDHPNVLPFLGLYFLDTSKQRVCLISPWMENGNLTQYLKENPQDSIDRVVLAYDVARGLAYLHEKKVIHGDLKGVNILITALGRATITDFGFSRLMESENLALSSKGSSTIQGTARWLAPECIIERQSVSYQSDIYAYGCVCYEIFTDQVPFYHCAHDVAVIFELVNGKRPTRTSQLDDTTWSIMEDCWQDVPSERPVASSLPSRFALLRDGVITPAEAWHDTSPPSLWQSVRYPEMCPNGSELESFLRCGFLRGLVSQKSQPGTSPLQSKTQIFYAIVVHDFTAESPAELDAKRGDAISVVAFSGREWFVAKHINQQGKSGLIPVSFVEIRDLMTGNAITDIKELIDSRQLPNAEDWERDEIRNKNNVETRIAFLGMKRRSSRNLMASKADSNNAIQQEVNYPWISRPFVLSPTIDSGIVQTISRKASPSPFPRYGHSLSVSNTSPGELYLFGGQLRKYARPGNDVYVFDVQKSSATLIRTKGSLPYPRVGHASALKHKKRKVLVVWGGQSTMLDDQLHLLDIASRNWIKVPVVGAIPVGRYGHTACLIEESLLVVFGGQRSESIYLNNLWSFDLENLENEATSNAWNLIQPTSEMPDCRAGHTCVTHENRLIIFGGTDGLCRFNDTWTFDFETKRWTELKCDGQVPAARDGHAAAVVGDMMYIYGGRGIDGEELEDVSVLSLSSHIWYSFQCHDMGTPPREKLGHAMVAVGSEIYVLGGRSASLRLSEALERPNCMHVLDTSRLTVEFSD
ncbi:kinase-like protein [Dendrothele bispora CBS 962.96]|uniref:Kinase-like protein n=1 Tax=Dendrothele bispora (strain CBS 962.96) TaxID=1314807 RepID=A0A4S8LWL7_DENBC|nr:kinase-like protein [Dendrothele bispora CBS 962.96]